MQPKDMLQPGKALVLVGPQGSGKGALAREVAAQHGSFVEVVAEDLDQRFGIDEVVAQQRQTVIVDGFPGRVETMQRLKTLISRPVCTVARMYQAPVTVKPPKFIFCTGSVNPMGLTCSDRWFVVVDVEAQAIGRKLAP